MFSHPFFVQIFKMFAAFVMHLRRLAFLLFGQLYGWMEGWHDGYKYKIHSKIIGFITPKM